MKKTSRKPLVFVGILMALTCVAMAYANLPVHTGASPRDPSIEHGSATDGLVTISGKLTQNKIFSGGDGKVSLLLDLHTKDVTGPIDEDHGHVDLVIVLDRSGSMKGKKLEDAKTAVLNLLEQLSEKDRFALVSYSDSVHRHSPLTPVTPAALRRFSKLVHNMSAGGGTNLGAGLQWGIDLLLRRPVSNNTGKVILISDGIANQGITSPAALGEMASIATEKAFSVSTIGVGSDFNELLMTAIANRGSGNYHYLENTAAFASIFQREFQWTKDVVATSVKVTIPLLKGVTLLDASGYTVRMNDHVAEVFPGDLLSGRTKKLFLTFRIPTDVGHVFAISRISVNYRHQHKNHRVVLPETFRIACVKDPTEALSSIDRDEWEKKVVFDDFNRLKEAVAQDVKKGDQHRALQKIRAYRAETEALNQAVQAPGVTRNLENEVGKLKEVVAETFAGSTGEIRDKQKKTAKSLQYEGYSGRRAGK